MVWSDSMPVAPFYVYNSDGDIVLEVTQDGLIVYDVADSANFYRIRPATPSGAPQLEHVFQGEVKTQLILDSAGNPSFMIQEGEAATDNSATLFATSAASILQLGILTDMLDVRYTDSTGKVDFKHEFGDKTIHLQRSITDGIVHIGDDSATAKILLNDKPVTREMAATVNETSTGDIGTTETITDTVTAALVNGRTYEVRWDGQLGPGTTDPAVGDRGILRLREDNVSGTEKDIYRHFWESSPSLVQRKNSLRTRYTATATGNKTFVVTLDVETGAAGVDWVRFGAVSRPSILTVTEVA